MIENEIKQLILHNEIVRKNILNLLHIKKMKFISEVTFINGIKPDFCFLNQDKQILAILECKGSDIEIKEYVGVIGKIFQYEYLKTRKIIQTFNKKCFFLLCIMSDLLKNLNICNFAYPKKINILIINNKNYCTTILNNKHISKKKKSKNLIMISPYFFKDIRIGEMYIVLKEILKDTLLNQSISKIKRKKYENNFLSKYKTPNSKCIRNVFISLTSLGLITPFNNIPSNEGFRMANLPFEEFCFTIYNNWYSEFINTLLSSFETWRKKNNSHKIINIKNKDIADIIRQKYNGADVKFLTESKERYISSWLNCMKNDFGCINFLPYKLKKNITINYNLTIENKTEVLDNIKKYSNIEYVNLYLNK
ncbi:hypothetical protein [Candidatus Phytoplasma pyri]|uniref:hypothetical protein n=1 Tax=Candidatus Phytoplasma pyri TaxID=47566 RepID=UPI003982E5EB